MQATCPRNCKCTHCKCEFTQAHSDARTRNRTTHMPMHAPARTPATLTAPPHPRPGPGQVPEAPFLGRHERRGESHRRSPPGADQDGPGAQERYGRRANYGSSGAVRYSGMPRPAAATHRCGCCRCWQARLDTAYRMRPSPRSSKCATRPACCTLCKQHCLCAVAEASFIQAGLHSASPSAPSPPPRLHPPYPELMPASVFPQTHVACAGSSPARMCTCLPMWA